MNFKLFQKLIIFIQKCTLEKNEPQLYMNQLLLYPNDTTVCNTEEKNEHK